MFFLFLFFCRMCKSMAGRHTVVPLPRNCKQVARRYFARRCFSCIPGSPTCMISSQLWLYTPWVKLVFHQFLLRCSEGKVSLCCTEKIIIFRCFFSTGLFCLYEKFQASHSSPSCFWSKNANFLYNICGGKFFLAKYLRFTKHAAF